MIQTPLSDPSIISSLGELRHWLADNAHLPDDTEIQVMGEKSGDDDPIIHLAKRTWRPNEQGCMVVYDADNKSRQVDQTLIVIGEWADDLFDDDDSDDDEDDDQDPPHPL